MLVTAFKVEERKKYDFLMGITSSFVCNATFHEGGHDVKATDILDIYHIYIT